MVKNYFRNVIAIISTLIVTVILTACGGGGGGGSDSGGGGDNGGNGISYTGSTSQVIVTTDNADDMTTGAYQGGATGSALGLGVALTDNSRPARPRTLILSQAIEKSVRSLDITSGANSGVSGAIVSESDTFGGNCGGSGSYTINIDDETGDFNGTLNYSNYCDEGVTLSGSMSFSGNYNISADAFRTLNCTISNLTVISGGDNFTAEGTINFNFTISPASAVFNALLRDNNLSKVYKIENFNMTFSEGVNYVDITVSGEFYDPDYGYAVISTSTPLRMYDVDEWPSQGVIVCTGNTGIAGGSTKAKLTALSASSYQVEADTNGDGTYDYDSGPLLWTDI